MSRTRSALLALPLVFIALAACSDDGYDKGGTAASTTADASGATPTTPTDASGGVTIALADNSLGKVLVDGEGRTLYLFTKDTPTVPACAGDCLSNWPPLTGATAPTPGDGLSAEDFGTITLTDGSLQTTFHGHPLYYFAGDPSPGDTNGQGVGSSWYVVDAEGNAIK